MWDENCTRQELPLQLLGRKLSQAVIFYRITGTEIALGGNCLQNYLDSNCTRQGVFVEYREGNCPRWEFLVKLSGRKLSQEGITFTIIGTVVVLSKNFPSNYRDRIVVGGNFLSNYRNRNCSRQELSLELSGRKCPRRELPLQLLGQKLSQAGMASTFIGRKVSQRRIAH